MQNVKTSKQTSHLAKRGLIVFFGLILLGGCAQFRGPAYQMSQEENDNFDKPLRAPKQQRAIKNTDIIAVERDGRSTELVIIKPPQLSMAAAKTVAEEMVLPKLSNDGVNRQTYNNLPLPVFINEAYGNQLGLDFVIQPSVRQAPDLVTLRLNSLLSQKDFYVLVTKTLANYGVTVFEQDNVLVFDYSADASPDAAPIIVTGEALPEVPSENRPIFYIYPLKAVRTPEIRGLLSNMFSKKDLTISEDITRNALIISGKLSKVKQAVEAARLFDQAPMSGMFNAIVQPTISPVVELTDNLQQILTAEGFSVRGASGSSAIKLLPLMSTGQLIIFTKSQ
jgi:general secretion pathway protein D